MGSSDVDELHAEGNWSRREFIVRVGLALATLPLLDRHSLAYADNIEGDISDKEAIEILLEEGEPGLKPKAVIENFWFQKPAMTRENPHWPADDVSYDYQHLSGAVAVGTVFEITPDTIQRLVSANAFMLSRGETPVLFGLRGCRLAGGSTISPYAGKHQIQTTRPDHNNLRCLLGVWNRQRNEIALFAGSTVPNVNLMDAYVHYGLGCNMMPTGLHKYQVGRHRGKSQPGAFKQRDPLWVIRSRKNLSYAANDKYDIWDDLDGRLPGDNIHAAIFDQRSKPPFFSSAGCQVVAGHYKASEPRGPWAEFRKAAGLTHPPVIINNAGSSSDDGRAFDYVLLTGDDAAIAASGQLQPTLRFGSSGELVADLQKALGLKKQNIDGTFGRRTLEKVIIWQKDSSLPLTGIVTKQIVQQLGLNWGNHPAVNT